ALDQTLRVLDLAAELRAPVVTTAVTLAQSDESARDRLREVFSILADRADRTGVHLAISPHGAEPEWLTQAINDLKCQNMKACLDSADWLARGLDPGEVASRWSGQLAWTHIRDAAIGSPERPGYEVPPGAGALDPARLLSSLQGAGYG